VVFLWRVCGGLRGNCGRFDGHISALKNMPTFTKIF
jgi:hypothetical protein